MTEVSDEMVEAAEVAVYGRHERGFINRPLIGAIDMRAALTAALAARAVRVKALEWKDGQAETPFGSYSVDYDHDEDVHDTPWCCWSPDSNLSHFATAEDAVAAAQADYEARILAALEDGQ